MENNVESLGVKSYCAGTNDIIGELAVVDFPFSLVDEYMDMSEILVLLLSLERMEASSKHAWHSISLLLYARCSGVLPSRFTMSG